MINYRGLVATCLTAGTLVLGGCSGSVEHHEGDISGGTFQLDNRRAGKDGYKGHLELVAYDKKFKIVIDSVGAPMYSEEAFTVVSMKSYRDGKLSRDYSPTAHTNPATVDWREEIIFEKNAGRRAISVGCELDHYRILAHLDKCQGEPPCRVLEKKR